MISNKLTFQELQKVLIPILRLENIDVVKANFNEVFHLVDDDKDYLKGIPPVNKAIHTTYLGFDVAVKGLRDIKVGNATFTILFKKKRGIFPFFSPNKKIVKDIKKVCEMVLDEPYLHTWNFPWAVKEGEWEEHIYQTGALNYDWKKDVKLSPLTIFSKNDEKQMITEFLFQRECYERKNGKTVLRKDWFEIFKESPSWAPLF